MRTEICLVQRLKAAGRTVASAESCTGGGIGHCLTAIPGSSAVYVGGVISYTNAVKNRILGVPQRILDTCGAVSAETACAMAQGVRSVTGADYGVSTTGLAGPDGDGSGKPVGLVYVGISTPQQCFAREFHLSGDREQVRAQAVEAALELIWNTLEEPVSGKSGQ